MRLAVLISLRAAVEGALVGNDSGRIDPVKRVNMSVRSNRKCRSI